MASHDLAYEEVIDFLTSGPALEEIINFNYSAEAQERIDYLLAGRKNDTLTPEESAEYEKFARADQFLQMIKVRARRRLGLPETE